MSDDTQSPDQFRVSLHPSWFQRQACKWTGHRDQHVWTDGTLLCGRCGEPPASRYLAGDVTIHIRRSTHE